MLKLINLTLWQNPVSALQDRALTPTMFIRVGLASCPAVWQKRSEVQFSPKNCTLEAVPTPHPCRVSFRVSKLITIMMVPKKFKHLCYITHNSKWRMSCWVWFRVSKLITMMVQKNSSTCYSSQLKMENESPGMTRGIKVDNHDGPKKFKYLL